MTWGLPGAGMVCKTIRQGFESLPRLYFVWPVYIIWPTRERFPNNYTHRMLRDLVLHHRTEHMMAKTEASNLREQLTEAQKELSELKRRKK